MKHLIRSTAIVFLLSAIPAQAFTFSHRDIVPIPQSDPIAGKKKVIDKSCLMICEQWGENDCLKWVMKCKGDPGYPKGMLMMQ